MQKEQMSRVYGEFFIVSGIMLDAILMSFLTVFQTYQEAVRVIMRGCVQWNSVYDWEDFASRLGSNPEMLDQSASA